MRLVTASHALLVLGLMGCGTEMGPARNDGNTQVGDPSTNTPATNGSQNDGNDASAPMPNADASSDGEVPSTDSGPVAPKSVRCAQGELGELTIEALTQAGSFPFASKTYALEDTTRATPAHGSDPGAATRALATTIWYPADGAPLGGVLSDRALAAGGPFPLVIYAHGFNLDSAGGQYLGEHLASHGFIVAAPTFPLSRQNAPGGPTFDDLVNQPDDVSFVIDSVLGFSAEQGHLFAGSIDESRIAVVGFSLGGTTAMLVGHHPQLGDERVRAVVSLAGIHAMFTDTFFNVRPLPALVMHGDLDAIVPYAPNARVALTAGTPNVHLASISKGTHIGFATLPLEPVLTGVGGLIVPAGANANNVDGIGCSQVQDIIPRDNAYLAPLGGAAMGLSDPAPLDPCKLDELSQEARSAPDQRTPTKQAVLAFLLAYLDADEKSRGSYCSFLETKLADNAGITVE